MMTLDEICIKNGTDKATLHPVKGHGYAPIYDAFFTPVRTKPVKVLEIGVGGGESILTWLDYFHVASIWGVDIVHDTNPWNTPKKESRYTFVQGSQLCKTFWACFLADQGKDWDIIIDDGSHMSDGVITSFNCLWPALAAGGLYCIEDLAVASDPGTVFVPDGWPNHLDWISKKMGQMNKDSDIAELHYFKELAIFRKRV